MRNMVINFEGLAWRRRVRSMPLDQRIEYLDAATLARSDEDRQAIYEAMRRLNPEIAEVAITRIEAKKKKENVR